MHYNMKFLWSGSIHHVTGHMTLWHYTSLLKRQGNSFYFVFALYFVSILFIVTMPSVRCKRHVIRCPAFSSAPDAKIPTLDLVLAPTYISIAQTNNVFFQKLIQTLIEKAQTLAALAAPSLVAKAKNNINRLFKAWNLNLYYGNLHKECYNFCQ